MPDDCTKLDKGDIRFYDNYVPTLEVGDYLINVAQRFNPLNQDPAKPQIDECYVKSQPFSVQGPRYTLPPEDIFSVFPPNNYLGVFDQFLPHVVLTKQDLPWERDLFDDRKTGQQTPWMALLLFTEDEVQQVATDTGKSLLIPQVAQWTANRAMSTIISASGFHQPHAGDGILWPAMPDEWYETDEFLQSTQCTVIDITPQAFSTLMPCRRDLRYLSHVRQVDASGKDSDVLKISGAGWYSILVGNRLPATPAAGTNDSPKRSIVHLVSLEGFEQYILEDRIGELPNVDRVRMISFQSWTFTCHPELEESFAELMQGLLHDKSTQTDKSTSFVLPVAQPADDSEDAQYAYQSLQVGYLPLRYQTRLGEQTFSWYRGPFSPVPIQNFISTKQETPNDPDNWQPFGTASSALIYDKSRGIFDVSYAVAWETGRLLALANGHLSHELMDWQRKGHQLLDLIIERQSQFAALKNFDPGDPQSEKVLLDQIERYAVTDGFMTYLLTQFSQQIAPKLSDQPPDPPDNPFPAYPDQPTPPLSPQSITDLLQQPDVMNAIREAGGQELEDITDWLARLYLLMGVPFENLVPHAGLLPTESVRFFYLDSNWLEALIEGAMSVGIESSRDRLYQDLMKDLIWNTTFEALQRIRDQQFGDLAHATPAGSIIQFDQESLTGLLLRSAVVSGYPGLEINAYTSYTVDQSGAVRPDVDSHINLLRMDRLSSDVMLCLWPAVPAVVTIDEPHEGVAFGFEDPPAKNKDGTPNTKQGYWLYLRSLDPDPTKYGKPLCSDLDIENNNCQYAIDAVATHLIDPATRILKISAANGLLDTMKNALPGTPVVNVRDFALEMIKVPEQAIFAAAPPASGGSNDG